MLVKDAKNADKIVKMLCAVNKNLIYGDNKELDVLFTSNFEEFCKLISLYPNENAADIKVDPALLPVPEPEEEPVKVSTEPEKPYIPPKKLDMDSVVVPENAPFAEEMNLLIHLAKKYPDDVSLTFYEPLSAAETEEFETRNNVKFTDELRYSFRLRTASDFPQVTLKFIRWSLPRGLSMTNGSGEMIIFI